jgi:hypothetical protein
MINHVVLMKFNPDVNDDTIDDLEKSLDDLPNKIVEIQAYEFGRDRVHSEKSYDFALRVVDFEGSDAGDIKKDEEGALLSRLGRA